MMEKNLVGSAQLGLPGGLQGLLPGDERTHVRSSLREQKLGHRRVDEDGQVTYKKKPTSELMSAIQLGIGLSIGGLSPKPKRDVLYGDFDVVESIFFPREGSNSTPAHRYSDFRFKTYAPVAFRYFRDLFGIQPEDFLLSLCNEPLKELSNPGASGSIFYLSNDDEFIIKTVQHKEAEFLQKLLPGYYMNLNQNPRTLLPKFYGLYCYQCGGKNIRFIIMNNLLPSTIVMHSKFDLKGSTYKRKASSKELTKSHPTYKDLDFLDFFPEGLMLETDNHFALLKTLERDCRVLQSFKIMDYSMLIGLHSLSGPDRDSQPSASYADHDFSSGKYGIERNRLRSSRFRTAQFSTALEAIQAKVDDPYIELINDSLGGIPVRTSRGEKLLLFIGIIDILQSYRFAKKLEHTFKSFITDGDTISVHRPGFYAQRFQKFFTTKVFKKIPAPLKITPSRKKSYLERQRSVIGEDLEFIDASSSTAGSSQPDILPISSSPLPPYSTSRGDNLLRVKHGSLLNYKKSHIEIQLRDITVHSSPKSQTMQDYFKSNAIKDSTVKFDEDSVAENSTGYYKQPGTSSGYVSNDYSGAEKEITTESHSSFPEDVSRDTSTTVSGIVIYPSIKLVQENPNLSMFITSVHQ